MKIALDASYSVGRDLSGVGVYSREILHAIAEREPDFDWRWLYRPHRFARGINEAHPRQVRPGILLDRALWRTSPLFHGLNQRLPLTRFRRQVVTFHDLFVMTAEYSTPEFRERFTAQARQAASTADHIIAVSQFTADQVVNLLGVETSRVSVVRHGIRRLSHPVNQQREHIVLHVGALQKRKNLVRLVQAFEAMPAEWSLILAGSNGFGAAEIFRAIEESPVRDRIRTTGYLSSEQLDQLYARASILAFPSLDEGFGMPVLEAMSIGIPVLAAGSSDGGSALREIAIGAALLIDPLRVEDISAGLTRLATDPDLRNSLISQGYNRAAQFTWRKAATETLAVYNKLR